MSKHLILASNSISHKESSYPLGPGGGDPDSGVEWVEYGYDSL